jgi:hypothetical protein
MSEMIERVAKVLATTDGNPDAWPQYSDEARMVIQAMRKPTDAMVGAGAGALLDENSITVWQRMIDEALEE